MPRPRFEKLDPETRATILSRATEEFAEHGYEGASYNRIIERCGLSKGAMYYYFDDKQDLFVTTLQDAVKRLIIDAGSVEAAEDAESFWHAVERWCERSLRLFRGDPAAVGLMRSFMKNVERGEGSAALSEIRRTGRTYMRAFIASGRNVGAIRGDLPEELLTSILMALEEGMDIWIAEHEAEFGDDELADVARLMCSLYRRVAAPADAVEQGAARKPVSPRRKKGRVR